MNDIGDDKPGYGKPPKHGQFHPGQSGNPNGRPKGKRNFLTELREELAVAVTYAEQGRKSRITKQRAIVKALVKKAMDGDVRAITALISFFARETDEPDEQVGPSPEEQKLLDDFGRRQAPNDDQDSDLGQTSET